MRSLGGGVKFGGGGGGGADGDCRFGANMVSKFFENSFRCGGTAFGCGCTLGNGLIGGVRAAGISLFAAVLRKYSKLKFQIFFFLSK